MNISATYVGYNADLEKQLKPDKVGDRFEDAPAWTLLTDEQLQSVAQQWQCSIEQLKDPSHASAFIGWPNQRHVRVLSWDIPAERVEDFKKSAEAAGVTFI